MPGLPNCITRILSGCSVPHLAEPFVFSWDWGAGTPVHPTHIPNLWMRRVAAHSPAHLELSPIRICCLTSRLPQIGCSDLTQGSTREKKLLKDFAAGAATERPALTVVLAHPRGVGARSTSAAPGDTPADPGDPHLEQPAPLPSSPPQLPPPALLYSRLGSAAAQPPAKLPPLRPPSWPPPHDKGSLRSPWGIPRERAGAG